VDQGQSLGGHHRRMCARKTGLGKRRCSFEIVLSALSFRTLQIYSYTGPVAVSKNTLVPTLIQVSRKHCVVLLVVSAGAGAWYEDPVCSPGGHSPAA